MFLFRVIEFPHFIDTQVREFQMGCCPKCGKFTSRNANDFNFVVTPASHSSSGSAFVTDKPTTDPLYPGHRFMSSNLSGQKVTQIYNSSGDVVKTK